MGRDASWLWALLWICACGDTARPTPPSPPAVLPASPAPPPAAPPAASEPSAVNPCDNPGPLTLELAAGATQATPWGIDFRYLLDEDKKRGPGYMFQLRSGERRWETRRDNSNWTRQLTWRGFCWRGAERPERRALRVKIQIAPVCKDGRLQELGGCGSALGPSRS
jgi:hypothetical protein